MTKTAPHIGPALIARAKAKVGKTNKPSMCQQEVRTLYGVPSIGDFDKDGDADAHDAWKAAKKLGKVIASRDAKSAPAGAYLYFSGSKHGHVAIGMGGDDCVSTDAGGRGRWGRESISGLARRWGLKLEGWIEVTGNGYRVLPEPVKPVTTSKVRYEVTATRLNARGGPSTNYPIKTVRAKGFQFNSTTAAGDWVRASKHWYHKSYLKVVTEKCASPKAKPVKLRIGTVNLPLDSAKLPQGPRRAKAAAKQINKSKLDAFGVQELDRAPNGTGHTYAKQLLQELGKGWKLLYPTTAFNENYWFVRDELSTGGSDADLILRSNAGGRHTTRATITKGGRQFRLFNTHLVSGASNGKARETQAKEIAKHVSDSTIIVGDLNQKTIPEPLAATHTTARDVAKKSTTRDWGTFLKWGGTRASKAATAFLDHVLPPKTATVNGYTIVGLDKNGNLTEPPIGDHFLVITSITFP